MSEGQFTNWFNKIVNAQTSTAPSVNMREGKKVEDAFLEYTGGRTSYKDYRESIEISKLQQFKKTRDAIQLHDQYMKTHNPKYKSFEDNCSEESLEAKENQELDRRLDIELQKKLNIYKEQEIVSEKVRKQLEEQENRYKERLRQRNAMVMKMHTNIQDYDKKFAHVKEYRTYEETLASDHSSEGLNSAKDKYMDIALLDKLGVSNEESESQEIKAIRTAHVSTINDRLIEHQKGMLSKLAKTNQHMSRERKNYKPLDKDG